jgi:hypothetical protein
MDWGCAYTSSETFHQGGSDTICSAYEIITAADLAAGYVDPTAIRFRGQLHVNSYGSTGAIAPAFAAGIIVMNGISNVINPALVVPCPLTECHADWVWHSFGFPLNLFGDEAGTYKFDIDSKSMRRLGNDSAILFVLESDHLGVSIDSGLRFRSGVRWLLKE